MTESDVNVDTATAQNRCGRNSPSVLTDGSLLYSVLEHDEWRIRELFPLLSKQCYGRSKLPSHWDFLARCLVREHHLYVPPVENLVDRSLFMELWSVRHLFVQPEPAVLDDADCSVTVCCRFRPAVAAAGGEDEADSRTVVPLHQRVQQVMAARKCSRGKAMKIVMQSQRTALMGTDADRLGDDVGAASEGQKTGVLNLEATAVKNQVLAMAPGVGLRQFEFSKVFGQSTSQEGVYEGAGRRLVMDFLNGISGSMIVYGQTGSGKTYVMFRARAPTTGAPSAPRA